MSRRGVQRLSVFTAWFSLFFILAWISSYSTKHVDYEHKWLPLKVALNRVAMGAWDFVAQRQAIFNGKLDLGQWYGNNELVSHSKFIDSSCWLFDLTLPRESIFLTTYRRPNKASFALLLSRSKLEQTSWVEFDQRGRYLSKEPVQKELNMDVDDQAKLKVCRAGEKILVQINGNDFSEKNIGVEGDRLWFGLANRSNRVLVDNIQQYSSQNEVLFEDDFSAGVNIWGVLLLSIFFSLIHLTQTKQKRVYEQLLILVVVTICLIFYALFDRYYWAKKLPLSSAQNSTFGMQLLQEFEKYRDEIFPYASFNQVYDQVKNTMNDIPLVDYEQHPMTGSYFAYGDDKSMQTVLLLGTSQTWGSGATFERFTLGAQTHSLLVRETSQNYLLEVYAVPGAITKTIVDNLPEVNFRNEKWGSIVINLSNNDPDPDEFRKGLNELLLWSQQRSDKIVIVKEANSPEFETNFLKERHKVVGELAMKYRCKVVETDDTIASQDVFRSGHIWWDFVHLTDWGQQLLAQDIVKALLEE